VWVSSPLQIKTGARFQKLALYLVIGKLEVLFAIDFQLGDIPDLAAQHLWARTHAQGR
jgi:hypothetical protein